MDLTTYEEEEEDEDEKKEEENEFGINIDCLYRLLNAPYSHTTVLISI